MTPPKMYPCSYQWDICNLSVTPLVPGKGFVSPCFTADVLSNTRWNLWFYPKGKDHPRYMSLFLQRCEDDDSGIEEVFVNVRLLVESHTVRFCRMKVMQGTRFKRGQVVGFTRLALSDSLHLAEKDWPYDNFLITCEMSLSDQVADDDPRWNPRTDLRCLSEDTRRLFQSGLHHDVLITCQGSEFKAHRAILVSRSPFFERLLRHDDATSRRLDMSDVPPDVLARLLSFIYSGIVDGGGGWSPLLEVARQFRMGDLVRRLVTFPKSFVALTQIEVDNMYVVWNDPFRGPTKFKSTYKSNKPYCSQLNLHCQFVWDDCHGNGDYVNLGIRLTGVRANAPVFILVYVQLYDGEELEMELHACHHVLEDDSWWEQSFPVEDLAPEISQDKDYRLLFEVNMCAGTHASFVREEVPQNQEERTPVAMDDFRQYSDDIGMLLTKGTFSDFTIICDEVEFKTHRCILSSRSPVFRSMLEHNMLEKMTNKVHIDDVRPQVMETLLQYMYSGLLPDLEYSSICELYEVADKYAVNVLKDRCGSLLVEKLDPANLELVLRLSDLHCDKVLLCRVKNYVRDSQRGALDLTKDNSEEPAVYL